MLKGISVCNLEAEVGFCTAWLPEDNGPVRCGRRGGLSASSRYRSPISHTITLTSPRKVT
jgi:hypothetical protein